MSNTKAVTSDVELRIPAADEGDRTSLHAQRIYELISGGYLPPADSVTKDGRPAWSLENLAAITGCGVTVLEKLLLAHAPRFRIEPGARH